MRRLSQLSTLLLICFFAFSYGEMTAQSGCPGCTLALPANLPPDTIVNTSLPNAVKGSAYSSDLSFRLPLTTTPVAAYDSTTPPNLPIAKFVITGIDGLPSGIKWEASQLTFNPTVQTDGCIRFCGTPSVADTFDLIVRLDVTVLIVTREANFHVQLIVEPTTVTNDGFTMTNVEGCGEVAVDFLNNVPSNGNAGFTYAWDFGDSTTSILENPPTHIYSEPGTYVVQYQALVDTTGYTLESVELLDVACADALGLGAPDIFFVIKDSNSDEIFNSGEDVSNIDLPFTFPIGLTLGAGNYTIEFWDEDSGLEGSDDLCGIVSFNILSNDTITSGDLTADLNIENPISEVLSTDTVWVFFQPNTPMITVNGATEVCGPASVFLFSSSGTGNTWWRNGEVLIGETDFDYTATESGDYQIVISTLDGCSASSDVQTVTIYPTVPALAFENFNNYLTVPDSLQANSLMVQWLLDGTELVGAIDWSLCAESSGLYTMEITDPSSGCTSTYEAAVQIDPDFDCTVSEKTPIEFTSVRIFPNPTFDNFNINFGTPLSESCRMRLMDMWGRVVSEKRTTTGAADYVLPVGGAPAGVYALEIQLEGGANLVRLVQVVVE